MTDKKRWPMINNRDHNKHRLELGLDRQINRRDVLHGMGMSAAALAAYSMGSNRLSLAAAIEQDLYAPEKEPNYYPPSKTGLRGSHAGSFETAHLQAWAGQTWDDPVDLDEEYDLIVVGAGISGLTAAFAYQQKMGPKARILIIDNHDDFGGHAKRVEFSHEGRTYLVPGGSGFMETPYYSEQAKQLLYDAGVNLKRLEVGQVKDLRFRAFDMNASICFDKETYGQAATLVDDMLPMDKKDKHGEFVLIKHIPHMPITAESKKELHDFLTSKKDVFAELSPEKRKAAPHSMSYNTFVTEYCGLSQATADALFTRQPGAIIGMTTDSTSLYEAILWTGLPALHVLGNQGKEIQKEKDSLPPIEGHYGPEGNAIITRNLVKRLVPAITEADTMEELETARFNYAKLDEPRSKVRIRLNSMGVNIKTLDKGSRVALSYLRGGKPYRVKARHCIYAGFHMYLPHLCPELPEKQKVALKANVKMPFIAANVFLRNGKPLHELGSASFYFPGRFLHECVTWGRSLGEHKQDYNPEDPVTIYMIGPMVGPHSKMNPQEQNRLGRHKLLSMTFEDYEIEVREQLASLFASTSFDIKEDLIGLTINRWPHGYTRQYNSLFDPEYEEGQRPHEIARKRFGPIAIANADASYVALANTAIDEGLRAANELLP
jgi:spermidine dehydrogenase